MLIPVILSGGSGTRLWPLSRAKYPKQFLNLFSDKTMIQETVLRLEGLKGIAQPMVICNIDSRFIVAHQMTEIGKKETEILLEPIAKNTLPPLVSAAYKISKNDPENIMFVLPSDHTIKNIKAFHSAIHKAEKAAESGNIVTFGIEPERPETGYGYIQFDRIGEKDFYKVTAFKEKPDLETAKQYLDAGNYAWNSGMYMFKVSSFLDEVKKYQPEMLKYCSDAVDNAKEDLDFLRLDKESFEKNISISIDYGLTEKTDKTVVVPMSAEWSDVGAWDALWEYLPKDENGNYTKGDVKLEDSENCYVLGSDHLVTTAGVKDLIIVDTKDALMVANKNKLDDVKSLFNKLKENNRNEAIKNRVDYRPWGYIDTVERDMRYKVQHLTVMPGEQPSYHYHFHRSEHWIVVSGTASVVIEDEEKILTENQSMYIPVGKKHSIANNGKIPLHLIEIQTGSYLEEDDIVRVKDSYGRL
ncbi:MAG: mannose-1-phosphate guanylyltransferase/mannose-6-phosphate isomerase [Treponema sp.]|nr:mannose-1-phosphate guanylyltransferase/mannose-6-phosphate isomerase [Treponema sp.]